MEINLIENKSKFKEEEYEYDEWDSDLLFGIFQKTDVVGKKTFNYNFIFVDGVLEEIPARLYFKDEREEFVAQVFVANIGAGFENGRIAKYKSQIIVTLPKNFSQSNEFSKLIQEELKKSIYTSKVFEPYILALLTTEDMRTKKRLILESLRKEEFLLAKELVKNSDNSLVIVDGNLSQDFFEILQDIDIKSPIVGIIKNFSWPKDFISQLKSYLDGLKTSIIYTELCGRYRYSFFLQLKGNMPDSLIRIDFLYPSSDAGEISCFADYISGRILGWAQSIGSRAPKNITPIKILEKRLRALAGDSKLYIRALRHRFGIKQVTHSHL